MTLAEIETKIHAALNFAANRNSDGVWSNLTPHLRTQALRARDVQLQDARKLAVPPDLDREGFTLVHRPLDRADWRDEHWIEQSYTPDCVELVRWLTGAGHAAPFYAGVLLRDSGGGDAAPAADFIHLDNTREAALQFLERAVPADVRAQYGRVRIFNVWRTITPPPQDVPLALCDQRTVDERDWVIGRTVEPNFPEGVPYVASVANPAQCWFFYSNVGLDDAIVFKGYDSDRDQPFGCLHGAFRHPAPGPVTVPRASAETRIFVLT
jgi:hypothetical protein